MEHKKRKTENTCEETRYLGINHLIQTRRGNNLIFYILCYINININHPMMLGQLLMTQ